VWPSPRPDIIGTATPQAATRGARGIEILSPTPPVECLSILGAGRSEKSSVSPDATIADVHVASSAGSRPLMTIAIAIAAIW
jgi:hypothetical protein